MPPVPLLIVNLFRRGSFFFNTNVLETKLPELGIDNVVVRNLVASGECELIEDYRQDPRGAACLVLAWNEPDDPLHIKIAYGMNYSTIRVVDVYRPDPERWSDDFRTRR